MVPLHVQKEIESITRQIIDKYKPQKILLFGSAVWGNFDENSDLDFLIIKEDTPELGRARARVLRNLIDKNLAADFFIYRPSEVKRCEQLGDPFVREILTKGKVLYGA